MQGVPRRILTLQTAGAGLRKLQQNERLCVALPAVTSLDTSVSDVSSDADQDGDQDGDDG